jgi:Spy/CpxP family protein refolding chaperone
MRKRAAVTLVLVALGAAAAPAALADPAFGPGAANGQGNNGPHENPGTKCHPPGQTSDLPECK